MYYTTWNKLWTLSFVNFREYMERYEERWDKKPLQNKQLQFYEVVEMPMLNFGSENWEKMWLDKSEIKSAETKILRPVAEYTLLDQN
jgi:hypothetical protein